MSTKRTTYNPSPKLTMPGMSWSVRTGNIIHMAGQVAFDENGEIVGEGDALAQAEQCFRNISQVLAADGATLADIAKLTCFVVSTDVYTAYAEVKRRLFPTDGPAGTTVVVKALLDPRFLLEVDVTAVLPDDT